MHLKFILKKSIDMYLSFSVLFILSTEGDCPDPDHNFLSQKIHTNTRSDIIQNTTGSDITLITLLQMG